MRPATPRQSEICPSHRMSDTSDPSLNDERGGATRLVFEGAAEAHLLADEIGKCSLVSLCVGGIAYRPSDALLVWQSISMQNEHN